MWGFNLRPTRAGIVSVILLALTVGYPGASTAQRPSRYKADLPARFSLSAVVVQAEPCPNAEPVTTTEVINIAVDNDLAVVKSQVFYQAQPVYQEPKDGDVRLIDYDERGNYLVWRELETQILSTPEGDRALKLYRLFRVSPEGKVVAEVSVHTQLIKSVSSTSSGVSDFDLVVLGLGQGFSRYLGEPATPSASGAQKLRSGGVLTGRDSGIWDLTFSQENGRLVREAGFWGKQEYPVLSVTTAGVAEIDGVVLARRGEVQLGEPDQPYKFTVELNSFSARSDSQLIEEVRARFARPLEKGNEILDRTGHEVVRTFEADPVPNPNPANPHCCVCETITKTISECGHLQASVRCGSDWCIQNVVTTATCKNTLPSGVASCPIVSPVPPQPMVVQTPVLLPNGGCPTGGNPVNYTVNLRNYDGCNGCTPTGENTIRTACEVAACPAGTALAGCASPRGIRRACS